MDPEAEAVELGVRSLLGIDVTVRTGRRFDVDGLDQGQARTLAERCLALIHDVHDPPYHPDEFEVVRPRRRSGRSCSWSSTTRPQRLSREAISS